MILLLTTQSGTGVVIVDEFPVAQQHGHSVIIAGTEKHTSRYDDDDDDDDNDDDNDDDDDDDCMTVHDCPMCLLGISYISCSVHHRYTWYTRYQQVPYTGIYYRLPVLLYVVLTVLYCIPGSYTVVYTWYTVLY